MAHRAAGAKLGIGELLGGRVDELLEALGDGPLGLLTLGGRERAVDGDGLEALGAQRLGLILDERDQGADDDRGSRHRQGGELEAKALARAGRHQDQRIPAFQGRPHGALLTRAEPPQAEMFPQSSSQVGPIHGRDRRIRLGHAVTRPGSSTRVSRSRRRPATPRVILRNEANGVPPAATERAGPSLLKRRWEMNHTRHRWSPARRRSGRSITGTP